MAGLSEGSESSRICANAGFLVRLVWTGNSQMTCQGRGAKLEKTAKWHLTVRSRVVGP